MFAIESANEIGADAAVSTAIQWLALAKNIILTMEQIWF